jgi:poly(hydroxyalkanoate) granule-associated protein
MVKKLKKIAQEQQQPSATKLLDSPLAGNIKESAQQIWLAGMGAFSRAQAEGGKVFEALVTEGMKLQRKTQSMAEDRIGEVAGRMTAVADGVTAKAGAQWDKLETIFEERVAKALNKLGVPSRGDIDALVDRIDALSAKLGHDAPVGKAARTVKVAPSRQAASAKPATATKVARKATASARRKAPVQDAPAAAARRTRRAAA